MERGDTVADRIKGITVVIGGDTTGLDKALQGVNKEISKTQQSLKDVERLLKFDPTNTTLLEQKQRLLGKAIEDNKTKVEALQQQVDNLHVDDDAFAEWQKSLSKINEQITKNQKELDKLNKQKEEFEKSGDVDSDEYRRVQSEIEKTTQKMEDLNKESAETFETLGRPISTDQMDKHLYAYSYSRIAQFTVVPELVCKTEYFKKGVPFVFALREIFPQAGLALPVDIRHMPAGRKLVLRSPAHIVHPGRIIDNGLAVKDGLHGSPGFPGEMPFGNGGYGVMTCPAPSETVGKGQ